MNAIENMINEECMNCGCTMLGCGDCFVKKAKDYYEQHKWHDLRNNPDDLPKRVSWYIIKVKSSDDYRCIFGCNRDISKHADAWREIEP